MLPAMKKNGFWHRTWPFAVLSAAAAFALFANTIPAGFVFDDEFFVLRNAHLASWDRIPLLLVSNIDAGAGFRSNLYRPLQSLTHFLDMRVYGPLPWGHHLTNVLLHAAAAACVFAWLRSFVPAVPAFLTCLLFSLHPLQSEAVAYISGRGDVLAVLFLCAGLALFRHSLAAAFVCAVLAMMSKESMAMFPALLLLSEKARGGKADWKRHLPFWVLGAAYALLRLTALNFADTLNFYGGARNVFTENPLYRFFTYLSTIPGSLRLFVWPDDLHHERSWPVHVSFSNPQVLAGAALLALALAVALFAWRRRRPISCAILFFLAATLPTSNLVAIINAIFYDHWFIIPGLGLALALAFLAGRAEKGRGLVAAALLIPLPLLSWQTARYNLVWRDAESLNTHILRHEPGSAKAHHNLAMALSGRGERLQAMEHYRKAIAIDDVFAHTHHNLAQEYTALGLTDLAVEEYNRALALDPGFYYSRVQLGLLEYRRGEPKKARAHLEEALRMHPYGDEARLLLAEVLLNSGNPGEAERVLLEGSKICASPRLAEALAKVRALRAESGTPPLESATSPKP